MNKLGPTGTFPDGKLDSKDEGGLVLDISNKKQRVIIDFHHNIRWIGMTPHEAKNFAEAIIKTAEEIEDNKQQKSKSDYMYIFKEIILKIEELEAEIARLRSLVTPLDS